MICPTSLTIARSGTRSSRTPMKKITNRATRINFMYPHSVISVQISEETKNPTKMAIPPIEGVTFLWILRRPGISTRFFLREYLIITGTIKKAITNDVIAAAISFAIFTKVRKTKQIGRILDSRHQIVQANSRPIVSLPQKLFLLFARHIVREHLLIDRSALAVEDPSPLIEIYHGTVHSKVQQSQTLVGAFVI